MRILLVSFYFAPYNSVGAVRATRMTEQLERLGHEMFVLTADAQPFPEGLDLALPAGRVTRTPWRNVNAPIDWLLGRKRVAERGYPGSRGGGLVARLGGLYRCITHIPDAQTGWSRHALRAGRRLIAERDIDLIYASASPFTGLAVASALSRETGVPWVAEFRDLWTDNHNYGYCGLRRRLERAYEERVLKSAKAFVTVSHELAQKLERRFQQPVAVVANGFDPEEIARIDTSDMAADARLDIVYTGSFYEQAYDVGILLDALGKLGGQRTDLRLRFFGRGHAALEARVRKEGLGELFTFSPTVARSEVLRLQRRADVLLFLSWAGPNPEGVLSSKIFEYFGARRPILAIGDPGSSAGRLIGPAGGFVTRDASAVAGWLRERISAKRALGREPDLPGEAAAIFSRAHRARELAAFLRRFAGGAQPA